MRYRTLGRTGIKVSAYSLGAMMFGTVGNPDHDDSIRIIPRTLVSRPHPTLDMAYRPPALQQPGPRRPAGERSAA
jgi:hypothetical protein